MEGREVRGKKRRKEIMEEGKDQEKNEGSKHGWKD